jgi:hypothetical protein
MAASSGGVTMDFIDGLTFPDLAEMWETAVQLR